MGGDSLNKSQEKWANAYRKMFGETLPKLSPYLSSEEEQSIIDELTKSLFQPSRKIKVIEDDLITIEREQYEKLKEDSDFLEALRAVGVDNWPGVEDAYEYLEENSS